LRRIAMKPLAIFLALAATAGADDIVPKAFPKDRYAETFRKSPFVLETKSTDVATDKSNPFQNLYLRGVGKADGKDHILIQRLGEERPMQFVINEPGPDELTVKSVRFGNSFRETKVVLQKGTETGEVGFKEDTINAPPPAAGQNRTAPQPGQFPKPGAPMPQQIPAVRPGQVATPVQPVPRPGGAVPMPQPTNIPQPPGAVHGRVNRPINN
jgi:hypothetical protein